jgi:hypothetical protein
MPRLPTPTTHVSTSGEPCPICAPHIKPAPQPRHRANRPTDAPSQNANSTLTGANRYARASPPVESR